jgi:serine/threonine protein kinase/Tol biopolymer transport system component
MALAPGSKLGPYEVVSVLGAGGMGEVYRARDTRLGRDVAIKVLPQHLASDANLQQRLEREARAVSRLSHPHICTLHDIGHQEGTDFLVMELVDGETLEHRLMRGPLAPDQVIRYSAQIADALAKAHKLGITHRDLKPANIMLTKAGAKLMDFGLAKQTGPAPLSQALTEMTMEHAKLSGEGTIVGTFQYMAPEQLEGREADSRTDIFALGEVMYEMTTGKPAFGGKSRASLIASILTTEPPAIALAQPLTPVSLERIVRKCIAKDPDDRWQSASDLATELAWLAESGSLAETQRQPEALSSRWREWALGAAAVGFALTALWFAFAYFRRPENPETSIRASLLPPGNASFLGSLTSSGHAISPDGTRLVFSAQPGGGRAVLWVRSLDSLSAQALAGTDYATLPFWSPDGQWIGFFADGKLKKIPAAGGAVQLICDAPVGRGGAWNSKGTIIFAPNINSPLYRVSASGGNPIELTKLDASRKQSTNRWPQFLPDGEHFLYLGRNLANDGSSGVFVGSLDGQPPKLILEGVRGGAQYALPGYLLFVRSANLLAQPFDLRTLTLHGEPVTIAGGVATLTNILRESFSVSENGRLVYQGVGEGGDAQMTILDRAGNLVSSLGGPGDYVKLRLSPDGSKVVVQEDDPASGENTLWVYDTHTAVKTRLTFGSMFNTYPVWSPDGIQVAFSSNRAGTMSIYTKPATGAEEEKRLNDSPNDERPTSWSSDGRHLAYEDRASTVPRIFFLPLSGERRPFPLQAGSYMSFEAVFSPDNRWVAYVSLESGRPEVYVTSFPDRSGKWQVSVGGGGTPRWRKDGRELFYSNNEGEVMAVEVNATGSSFAAGSEKALPLKCALYQALAGCVFDVFPDGQRFIMATLRPETSRSPLTLISNWPAALPK